MTTDLGIEWLSSIDAFGLILCVMLAIIGIKMRSFVFVLISSMGWILLGIQIFLNTQEALVFLLVIAVSAAQCFYGLKMEDRYS